MSGTLGAAIGSVIRIRRCRDLTGMVMQISFDADMCTSQWPFSIASS
jgi:hypothetical protein